MGARDCRHLAEARNPLENLTRHHGMLPDVGVLLVGEAPWSVEDPVGDRKLPNVVQPRRAAQFPNRRSLEAQHARDSGRDRTRAVGMVAGPRGLAS